MKKIDGNPLTVNFEDFKGRIHKLLYNALQIENETINTQTLLGGLMLTIQEAGQCQDQTPSMFFSLHFRESLDLRSTNKQK